MKGLAECWQYVCDIRHEAEILEKFLWLQVFWNTFGALPLLIWGPCFVLHMHDSGEMLL